MRRYALQAPTGGSDLRPRRARRIYPLVTRAPIAPDSPPGLQVFLVQSHPGETAHIVRHGGGEDTGCDCPWFKENGHCDHLHHLDVNGDILFGDPEESDAEGGR